jgi:hypothetical protein
VPRVEAPDRRAHPRAQDLRRAAAEVYFGELKRELVEDVQGLVYVRDDEELVGVAEVRAGFAVQHEVALAAADLAERLVRGRVDDDVAVERVERAADGHARARAAVVRRAGGRDGFPARRRAVAAAEEAQAQHRRGALQGHEIPPRVDDALRRDLRPAGTRQAVVELAKHGPLHASTVVEDL